MIVAPFFEDDWNQALRWIQHDAYDDALRIIVGTCREHVASAMSLLQVGWPKQWPTELRFDHRTIQGAHDILAAAWRHSTTPAQTVLPLSAPPAPVADAAIDWLKWLRAEIRSWREEPRLVALVFTILANQNQPAGYQAEEELSEHLRYRFAAVPWRLERPPARPDDAGRGS